jgi:tetraacyldisaccharide-1-P 4'-kinase/lauroyl/myristoyl acyltransferase
LTALKPLELAYRGVNRLRRAAYRAGWLKARRLARPVISIGNIAMGGTGKTPAVIAIARYLHDRGLRVAVLTRGHGRLDKRTAGVMTSNDASKWGDEPALIRQSTKCDVIVGSNRYELGSFYLSRYGFDVFLLDDGFQHLQLRRDLDIVIDAPSRFHREGRGALRHADIVIPRRLRLSIPPQIRGERVFAFSGLADNAQFFESLRTEGVTVAGSRGFPDHHRYTAADLAEIRNAAGDLPIVTTEKDAVKIDDPSILVARAEMEIDAGVLARIEEVAAKAGPIAAGAQGASRRRRKRRKPQWLQLIEYGLYLGMARMARAMPEETAWRWGGRIGFASGRIVRRRDEMALRNLALIFPELTSEERRKIVDDCWRHFGRELILYLQSQGLSQEELAERCVFVNSELVEESIARGKGTLLISAHWGGWELGGLAIMSLVRNVRTLARPLDNELLERDLQRYREKTGAEVVDRRKAGRFLLKSLAENAVIALLPDQAVQPQEGELVPFLGRPAWTTVMPAKLALRTGATIVFAFCIPEGRRHRLEFEEAIRIELLPEEERDPVRLTARINEVMSRRIRERPDLYLWMHDRWKGTGGSST